MHEHMAKCQTQRSDMQITAEIMQTYDLLKFAIARSNGFSFVQRRKWSPTANIP